MQKIHVSLSTVQDKSYDIIIDCLHSLNFGSKRVCIVTNPTIAGLHLGYILSKIVAKNIIVSVVPDGEEYKNMTHIEHILEDMFNAKFDRKDVLIAFGGGVVGDMSGFAAALYERGIDFIQIPTTLLACVDSSVGGKTGINNKFGKNLIGAFWQPRAVYIDTYFLQTLPHREFSAGMAEVIKMAVMFDLEFFRFLQNANPLKNPDDLKAIIAKCVELKAKVVELDERESGIRAVLNYGHTFAHVIENETQYKCFLHGEAVGIGMVMANRLALEMGFIGQNECEEIKALITKYDLPTSYKPDSINEFYKKFSLDKKTSSDIITFILPLGIGGYKIEKNAPKELVLKAIDED